MNSEPLVQFENVTIVRNGRVALDALNLKIDSNENVAILGPNGCGKSTLVKAIAGDVRPYAGKGFIRVGGKARWNLFELRKTLGIVSNELQATCEKEITALDLVVSGFFGSYGVLEPYEVVQSQWEAAKLSLDSVDAGHLAERLTCELSSGEGRRVLLARALVNAPRALLFDEPTTSLDMKSGHHFMNSLRQIAASGTNLVLVTHHVEEIIPEVQRVILLKQGRVFLDGPTGVIMTSDNLSALFETQIILEKSCGVFRAQVGGQH